VVAKPHRNFDPASVQSWANARLGRIQRIAALHVVRELPRSPIGKVLKRELRARLTGSP